MANFQRNWAVVIGINDYQNQVPKLKTAKNDAEKLADILAESHKYEVILITDDTDCKPTLESLLNLLTKQLPEKINKDDRLLFYFAGHGIAKESDRGPAGFLVPQDADVKNNANLLPMQTLHDRLATLKCRHLLVILDCCFAGTLRWSSTRLATVTPRKIHKEHYDRFINSPAWQAITSAAHNQEAYDINPNNRELLAGKNHSPFAEALFKALQGEADIMPAADEKNKRGDGVITATELSQYLQYQVAEIAGDRQTTQLWPLPKHNRGEYIFLHPDRPPNLKSAPELNKDNNPYRGLESFEEKHAQFFFGRQELIKKLEARISQPQQPLTVVLGVSGSGKSSLVKAGLIPCLKHFSEEEVSQKILDSAGNLTNVIIAIIRSLPKFPLEFWAFTYTHHWHILTPMRPAESPFTALARTIFPISDFPIDNELKTVHFLREVLQQEIEKLDREINQFDEAGQQDEEFKRLEGDREKLAGFVREWNNNPRKLFADHFEELYALCQQEDQKEQLKQVCLGCLKRFSKSLNSEEFVKIVQEWSRNHPDSKLLLVIDQFEELITLSRDEKQDKKSNKQPEWQQFLKFLEEVIAANLEQLRIVVTLRSDFEPKFLNSDVLKSQWAKARFPVRAMRADELRQTIERPAAEMALDFEPPNLVDRLIEEVGQMPGALPLLSFTLSEFYIKLYQKWVKDGSSDRALRIDADFEKEGGVAGSLTRRANQEYNELPDDAHRDTMRRVILRMVTLEGGEPVRRRVRLSELNYANKQDPTQLDENENQRVKVVLESLDKARLVVSGQETGEPYVEPAHDFLVKGWGKLQKWLEEKHQDLLLQRRLTPAAEEWKRSVEEWQKQVKSQKQPPSFLEKTESFLDWLDRGLYPTERLIGKEMTKLVRLWWQAPDTQEKQKNKPGQFLWNANPYLDVLNEEIESSDNWFNGLEAEFVQRSIKQKRRNVRLRRFAYTAILVGVTTAAIVFNVLRGIAEQRRKEALARQFVAQAELTRSQQTSPLLRSVLLALESTHLSDSDQANNIIRYGLAFLSPLEARISFENNEVVSSSPDGRYQATVSGSGRLNNDISWQVQVRDLTNGQEAVRLVSPKSEVQTIYQAISPNKRYIVRATRGSSIARVSEIYSNSKVQRVVAYLSHDGAITSVAFSHDGRYIGTASGDTSQPPQGYTTQGDKTVRLWKMPPVFTSFSQEDKFHTLRAIAFSPDSKYMAVARDSDNTVALWEVDSGNTVTNCPAHAEHIGFEDVSFSPDGRYLAIAPSLAGGHFQLWDLAKRTCDSFPGNPDLGYVTFSPKGKYMVTGDRRANTYQVWELATHKEVKIDSTVGDQEQTGSIAISPNEKYIATAKGNNTVQVLDVETGTVREYTAQTMEAVYVGFSPDGKYIAVASSDNTARLWEVESGKEIHSFSHKDSVERIAFSPDGKYIATASKDKTARLWKIANGQEVHRFSHESEVVAIAFSPDGKYLATAASTTIGGGEAVGVSKGDNTVRVWEVESDKDKPITRLRHQGQVSGISFSPNGKYLITQTYISEEASIGESGNTVPAYMWLWRKEDLAEEACKRLTRNLTQTEWEQYMPSNETYRKTCPNLPVGSELLTIPEK